MKRIILSALVAFAVTGMFTSCGSTSKLKGEEPIMNTGRPEVIDYQGQTLGSAIPDWVVAIGDGSQKRVRKSLDIDNSKEIFILQNKGNDLDFLKAWTDQVDARAEIASSIEQTIAQTVQSEMEVRQADEQLKTKAAKIYSATMTNVTMNGLCKEDYYWIKTRTPKLDVKNPVLPTDYNYEYTYYVVYTLDKKLYEKQISEAMNDIDDNDDQTSFLKDVLSEKLKSTILIPESEDISFDYVPVEYDYIDAK